MHKATFLVPLTDNEGAAFTQDDWDWLQDSLVAQFGGWSIESTVQGAWKAEDGKVYRDQSFRYSVATDAIDTLRDLLHEVKRRFRQLAIYLELSEARVEIL